jgi:hypothetical protein
MRQIYPGEMFAVRHLLVQSDGSFPMGGFGVAEYTPGGLDRYEVPPR